MNYTISIAEAAEIDIREAFHWYNEQKESLGNLFEDHISRAVKSIQLNPYKTQIRYESTRIFFLRKFPYGLHFRINDSLKSILIVAVFHTSKDAFNWQIRDNQT